MTTNTKLPSLKDLFRGLPPQNPNTPESTIAQQIVDSIQPQDREEYLLQALTALAPIWKIHIRYIKIKRVFQTAMGGGAHDKVKLPKERVVPRIDNDGNVTIVTNPDYTRQISYKNTLIKTEWEDFLAERLSTNDPAKPYILIKDATVADLRLAAKNRRDLAEKNSIWADRYDNLATQMTLKSATTLGQLTPEDIKGIF